MIVPVSYWLYWIETMWSIYPLLRLRDFLLLRPPLLLGLLECLFGVRDLRLGVRERRFGLFDRRFGLLVERRAGLLLGVSNWRLGLGDGFRLGLSDFLGLLDLLLASLGDLQNQSQYFSTKYILQHYQYILPEDSKKKSMQSLVCNYMCKYLYDVYKYMISHVSNCYTKLKAYSGLKYSMHLICMINT